eukprot:29880_1
MALNIIDKLIELTNNTEQKSETSSAEWHKDIGYPLFCLDPYAERNFIYKGNKYTKKAFIDYDRQQFEDKINELYHEESNNIQLEDGYAPFCKHLFVPNFVKNLKHSIIEITKDNEKYLKCDYVKRRDEELGDVQMTQSTRVKEMIFFLQFSQSV